VGKVFQEMACQVGKRLACFYIFLATSGTIGYLNDITAVFAHIVITQVVSHIYRLALTLKAKTIKNM
jgi:hypothetical protein